MTNLEAQPGSDDATFSGRELERLQPAEFSARENEVGNSGKDPETTRKIKEILNPKIRLDETKRDWRLTDEEKRTGRQGIADARAELERARQRAQDNRS
jgi:hypothetical protein